MTMGEHLPKVALEIVTRKIKSFCPAFVVRLRLTTFHKFANFACNLIYNFSNGSNKCEDTMIVMIDDERINMSCAHMCV